MRPLSSGRPTYIYCWRIMKFNWSKYNYNICWKTFIILRVVNWSWSFFSRMLFGVITQPVDFASFLVAIVILNLLMYFAFYIIMKVGANERNSNILYTIIIVTLKYLMNFWSTCFKSRHPWQYCNLQQVKLCCYYEKDLINVFLHCERTFIRCFELYTYLDQVPN